MSTTSTPSVPLRPMPARPNIEFLRNEAKRRLVAQRNGDPDLKLSAVQFDLAREYGFASWRALKTAFEQPSPLIMEAAGDWIGRLSGGTRVALHVRPNGVTGDSPDYGAFDFAIPDFNAGGGRMRVALPSINVAFDGEWDDKSEQWQGRWRQDGLDQPMTFARGTFPPSPIVKGLDGVWEGIVAGEDVRLIFRIRTTEHGTHALCDSPDRSGNNVPLSAITRDGDAVILTIRTARFEGTMATAGDHIEGRYFRGDTVCPLSLRRRQPGDTPLARPGVSLSQPELAACAGRYRYISGDQETQVTLDGDGLRVHLSDGRVIGLAPVAEREFTFRQGVGKIVFDAGLEGTIVGFRLSSYNRHSHATRVD